MTQQLKTQGTYRAQIRRNQPTLMILLIDHSGSMNDPFGADSDKTIISHAVSDVVNRTLYDLTLRCTKGLELYDYYDLAIVTYGAGVRSVLSNSARGWVPISVVSNNPLRLENRKRKQPDGVGGLVEANIVFPIWLEPHAEGGTPMCAAFRSLKQMLHDWIEEHPESFPPTILHLTDGESTDGDPTNIITELSSMGTKDGNVLIFNCHLSSNKKAKIEFASSTRGLPDEFAHLLYSLSSEFPVKFRETASSLGVKLEDGARGFVFNGDPVSLVQFFEIGTRGPLFR